MARLTPTAQELEAHVEDILDRTDPADRQIWVKSACTAAMYATIERIRMECIEQAEAIPEHDTLIALNAQSQLCKRLCEELSASIIEVVEDDEPEDDTDASGTPSRRRADYTP